MFKRVHFAPTNKIYSGGSATPSPSLTNSSLPSSSSSEILTPPPDDDDEYRHVVYPKTPIWAHPELSPDIYTPQTMQIHFLLAYSPHAEPAFEFDMIYPPTNGHGQYSIHAFSECATSPPVQSLAISHPLLKYEIDVTPSDELHVGFITVADVLLTVYRHLRHSIHPLDYADLPDGERREGVDAAYYVRTGSIPDREERAQEERKGIKNIDLLMGCTRFMGLSGTLEGPGVWELNVA